MPVAVAVLLPSAPLLDCCPPRLGGRLDMVLGEEGTGESLQWEEETQAVRPKQKTVCAYVCAPIRLETRKWGRVLDQCFFGRWQRRRLHGD